MGGHAGHVARVHAREGLDPFVAAGVAFVLGVGAELLGVGSVDGGGGLVFGDAVVERFPGAGEAGDGESAVDVTLGQAGILRDDAGESGGREGGGEELGHALVGDADHADLVGRPGLIDDPVDDLGDVESGAPGIDVARSERGSGAAEVERDEVVALMNEGGGQRAGLVLGDELAGLDAGERLLVACGGAAAVAAQPGAAVGGGVKHGGARALEALACGCGVEDVDGDAAAIVDGDVARLAVVAVGGVGSGWEVAAEHRGGVGHRGWLPFRWWRSAASVPRVVRCAQDRRPWLRLRS